MYRIVTTTQFRKDYKRAYKRGLNLGLLETVVEILASGKTLPKKYKDHALSGNWSDTRECHIAPDWLLLYKIEDDVLILTLTRTGTHSDLFKE